MPPVLGPVSPSPTALWSCARRQRQHGASVDQSEEAHLLALEELLDDDLAAGGAETAAEDVGDRGVGLVVRAGDDHALARGQPIGLDDDGAARARPRRRGPERARRSGRTPPSGCPYLAHRSLVKALEPSRTDAARLGPKVRMPASSRWSARPATSGASGPTTTNPMPRSRHSRARAAKSHRVDGDALGVPGDAAIAGGRSRAYRPGPSARAPSTAHARGRPTRRRVGSTPATSLVPCRMPLALPVALCIIRSEADKRSAKGVMNEPPFDPAPQAAPAHNLPEYSVSELSARLKRTVEGRLRPGARARRGVAPLAAALGPSLSQPQGRRRGAGRGVLAQHRGRPALRARGGARGGLQRPHHHLSRALAIPARDRHGRAGRGRGADGAARKPAPQARRRRTVQTRRASARCRSCPKSSGW